LFNNLNRTKKFKANLIKKPFLKDTAFATNLNSLPLFSEEILPDTSLIKLKDFRNFPTESNIDSLDDSYENFKAINYIHHLNYLNLLNVNTMYVQPL
jgi:hypothetical protein